MLFIVTCNEGKKENNGKTEKKSNKFHNKPPYDMFCYIGFSFQGRICMLGKERNEVEYEYI